MFRIIIAALFIYAIWRLWQKMGRGGWSPKPKRPDTLDEMVACKRCGTFVIKNGAMENGGNYYCSTNCLQSR